METPWTYPSAILRASASPTYRPLTALPGKGRGFFLPINFRNEKSLQITDCCWPCRPLHNYNKLNHIDQVDHIDLGHHSPQPLGQQRAEHRHSLQYSLVTSDGNVIMTENILCLRWFSSWRRKLLLTFVPSWEFDQMSSFGLGHLVSSLRQLQLQRFGLDKVQLAKHTFSTSKVQLAEHTFFHI